jgi:predicted transcriptional regulator
MKVVTIGIMPQEKMRARAIAIAIARGQYKPKPSDPKIWFPSMKSLAETLSDKNMELIKFIAEQKPESIAALSQQTGRAGSNLSRTLNRLAIFGFITLQRRPGNVVRPIAKAVKYNIVGCADSNKISPASDRTYPTW